MRLGGSGSSDRHRLSGLNNRNDLLAVLEAGVSVSAWSGPGEASPPTFGLPSVHVYACVCEYVTECVSVCVCVCVREREHCPPLKRAPVLWDQGPVFMTSSNLNHLPEGCIFKCRLRRGLGFQQLSGRVVGRGEQGPLLGAFRAAVCRALDQPCPLRHNCTPGRGPGSVPASVVCSTRKPGHSLVGLMGPSIRQELPLKNSDWVWVPTWHPAMSVGSP